MASLHPPPDLRPARLNALGEFAASIAHEVRQPLAAVTLNADACLALLAHDPPRLDEARAALRLVRAAGAAAGDMLRSLHGMASRDGPVRSRFLLDDALRETMALLRADLRRRGIRVDEHYGLDLVELDADRVQLMQVVINLVRNAAEALDAVHERPRRLTLRSALRGGAVHLRLADNGAGIPAALRARIFEPLFTTKPGGTGMGLAICRGIVQAHGGQIRASGARPHGTVFHLSFKDYTLWTPSRS